MSSPEKKLVIVSAANQPILDAARAGRNHMETPF